MISLNNKMGRVVEVCEFDQKERFQSFSLTKVTFHISMAFFFVNEIGGNVNVCSFDI